MVIAKVNNFTTKCYRTNIVTIGHDYSSTLSHSGVLFRIVVA